MMVAVGVVVHLFLCLRVDIGEASGESLPGRGVDVNIGGVFGRRCPPWRRLLRCFLLGLCLPGGNTSPVLRRSDDGGIGVVSFLRALLWKSRAYLACGLMASRTLEDWWFGRRLSLKLSFLFLCRSGCISLFASLPRYEVLSLWALV
jgi:hypothetical protein